MKIGSKDIVQSKTALVTGASSGIGEATAERLASAGYKVYGTSRRGAQAGQRSFAMLPLDVTSDESAETAVTDVLRLEGRIDVLVNNAGIIRWAGFPEADQDNLDRHLAVHVGGSFNTARAAWPHMAEAGYGRIVMTTSAGLFGLPNNISYATAKGAVIGLTRSLTVAGADHGIKVNLIAPGAMTRMAGRASDASPDMSPDLVAPMVAYLAHEDCPVSGEIYAAGFGRFARIFVAMTPGYVHAGGIPTIEDVADHWAAINDEAGYGVPADLVDWSATFMAHLPPKPE
jgi:NAD(P)-dependent dehydrogenase (short-subunit alcohol dehydrogenase family)